MSATDVSVIVRSCGRPGLLARALASIRAQTVPPAEIVVVAIGPEGASALNIPTGDIEMRVVRVETGRPRGAALNDGIRVAAGRWYAFLDDDDTWDPAFLEVMIAAGSTDESASSLGGVVCQTEIIYERYREGCAINCGSKPINPKLAQISLRELVAANQFTINAALWHRRVFSVLGAFREDLNLLEDWEFNVRAARAFQLKVVPRMLARYHRRPPGDPMPNTERRENDRAARALQETWRQTDSVGAGSDAIGLRDRLRVLERFISRVCSRLRWWLR